ncbi:MAG: hypothetical protein RIQ60_2836 [Pseudomonadota bacterium]
MGPGLADWLPVQFSNLIRADHQGVRIPSRDGPGLGQRKTLAETSGCFTHQRLFVDFRRYDGVRQAQPVQQFPTVARGRGKDKACSGSHVFTRR